MPAAPGRRRRGLAEGRNVVELGAGTGICGFVAASLGARVAVTDLQEGLPLLKENIALNRECFKHAPEAIALNWDEAYACSVHSSQLPAVAQLQAAGLWPVDWILLSECTYNREFAEPLKAAIRALSGGGPPGHRCEVLMAHAHRGAEWAFERWFGGALSQVPSAYLRIPDSLNSETLSVWRGSIAQRVDDPP